jgi:serine/threonine protein kinase
MAPEVLVGLPHSAKCEVWSIGVCMFVLLTGTFPYGDERDEVLPTIMSVDLATEFEWESCSALARDACLALLTVQPKQRPTALQAMALPFFMRFPQPRVRVA